MRGEQAFSEAQRRLRAQHHRVGVELAQLAGTRAHDAAHILYGDEEVAAVDLVDSPRGLDDLLVRPFSAEDPVGELDQDVDVAAHLLGVEADRPAVAYEHDGIERLVELADDAPDTGGGLVDAVLTAHEVVIGPDRLDELDAGNRVLRDGGKECEDSPRAPPAEPGIGHRAPVDAQGEASEDVEDDRLLAGPVIRSDWLGSWLGMHLTKLCRPLWSVVELSKAHLP